jgi:hypothetical protein
MLAQWALAQQVWLRNPLGLLVVAVAVAALVFLPVAVAVAALLLWARLVCLARQVALLLRVQQEVV